MKRFLAVLALVAVAAFAGVLVGGATQSAGKARAHATPASAGPGAGCPSSCAPENCAPGASCPAMTGSSGANTAHADLSNGACDATGGSGCPSEAAPRAASNTSVALATGQR